MMPTQADIVDELRRRATTPAQQAIVQELERRRTAGPATREFRTNPETEAIQEAFPTTMVPRLEQPGETGAFVGELGGQMASSLTGPFQPVARPVFGAAGAALGSQVERFVRGEGVDTEQAKREALFSFLPEAGESLVRGAARSFGRATRGGHELRQDAAAQIARDAAPHIFHPPGSAQVKHLFDVLDKHDVGGPLLEARFVLDSLAASERTTVLKELKALHPEALTVLSEGGQLSAKEMQRVRSLLGVQADITQRSGRPGAARTAQLLRQMQQGVDIDQDALLSGLDLPGSAQTAREAYHRVKATERLQQVLTTSPVTKSLKGGDEYLFDLNRFHNLLKDNKTREIRAVKKDLASIPGAQEAFDAFFQDVKRLVPKGQLTFTDTSGLRRNAGVAFVDRLLSALITHPMGQALFRQGIVAGRGRMDLSALALMLNMVARQDAAQGEDVRALALPAGLLSTPAGQTVTVPPHTP
jgi:hypothetical protein